MNIMLVDKQVETITTKTYTLNVEGKTYTWIDYVTPNDVVIDTTLRDERGNEISMEDVAFASEIESYIDFVEGKK